MKAWPPSTFLSTLVQDELVCRQGRLLERRVTAGFRDRGKTFDTFDFNKKMPSVPMIVRHRPPLKLQ